MKELTQKSIDRAFRIALTSQKESGTNTSGLLYNQWVFDTAILFGDATVIELPAVCDEITARYELAKYLQQHI
jgi:hypothetical protein